MGIPPVKTEMPGHESGRVCDFAWYDERAGKIDEARHLIPDPSFSFVPTGLAAGVSFRSHRAGRMPRDESSVDRR